MVRRLCLRNSIESVGSKVNKGIVALLLRVEILRACSHMSTSVPEITIGPAGSSSNASDKGRVDEPLQFDDDAVDSDWEEEEDELVLESNQPTYRIEDMESGRMPHFKYMPEDVGERRREAEGDRGVWKHSRCNGQVQVIVKPDQEHGKHMATLDYSVMKGRVQKLIPKMLTGRNAAELPKDTRAAVTDPVRRADDDLTQLREVQNDLQRPWEREGSLLQFDEEVGSEHDSVDGDSEDEQDWDDFSEQRRQDQGYGNGSSGLSFQDQVDHNLTEMQGSLSTGHQKAMMLGLETTPRCTEKCYVCGGASGEDKCGLNTGTGQTVFDECEECNDEESGAKHGQQRFEKHMRTAAGGWKCANYEQLTAMEIERCGVPYDDFQSFTDTFLQSHTHKEHPFQIPRTLATLLIDGNIKEFDRLTACCANPQCLLLMGIESLPRFARWKASAQEPQHEVISEDKSDKITLRRALMLAHMMYLIGLDEEEEQTPHEERLGLSRRQFEVLVEHTMMKSFWMQMRLRKYMACADFALVYSEAGKFPYQFESPIDVVEQMKKLAKSYVKTDVIPSMLECTHGPQISTELKKLIGGDYEPQAQDALLAIMIRAHQEKHGNVRESFVPLTNPMHEVPTQRTGGVPHMIYGPFDYELNGDLSAKQVQHASYITQMAYHCREPVAHTYHRWMTCPRLKLECHPDEEHNGWIFTNFGFLQTCFAVLLEAKHTARIYYARGDDAGAMWARFHHIKQSNRSLQPHEIWNLIRKTNSQYGKAEWTYGSFVAASPFSDGAVAHAGNVQPFLRYRACFRGLGDPDFAKVMEDYKRLQKEVAEIDNDADKLAMGNRWIEEQLSRPTVQERVESFLKYLPCGNNIGCQTYWTRGANKDPNVGNSACCFTLELPTWANGQDPGWPSMQMTMKDRAEARNMMTVPVTRVTLIGIQWAEAIRKQTAKTPTQARHQPDLIALGGNRGRARVAEALGHAKEVPHTKQTSSYWHNKKLARAFDGRVFKAARHTTTICNLYDDLPNQRTVPTMLGHSHDQKLCIPDDSDAVFDATLALGNPEDPESMGNRLSKYQTWLQTQRRTEPRLNRRKEFEKLSMSSHDLYARAPKAMRSGMLRTEPIDKEPTWTVRTTSTSPVSSTPPRLNWLTPAAKRSVLQMTNGDKTNDQEWKRRKALDSKLRKQYPSIPQPGIKMTGVQRLVRRKAAKERYVEERPYLAAHNDNGNDGSKAKNMLVSMPVDIEMDLEYAIKDFVTHERSIAEQTVQPEIKKQLHLKNQFSTPLSPNQHRRQNADRPKQLSSCGTVTTDNPLHVAIEHLPDFMVGKDGWLMKNGATALDRQNNGIVKYPQHLTQKSRKTVLTLERFKLFEAEFEKNLDKLEQAYNKRMEALQALQTCADEGAFGLPEDFDPWKDQFEPPEHVAEMPVWQEFEHWANERFGSQAQRHSYIRKLAAEHDWQKSCLHDSWKTCRPMKPLDVLTVEQRAELQVWAGHMEQELKHSSLRPDCIFGEGVQQNLNASEEMRAGFNRKCRLTLAGRYAPSGQLPMEFDNTKTYSSYRTGRLNNEREARFELGRRSDSAFASLPLLPLDQVDLQDFGGLTNFADERYDQNGNLVTTIHPPWAVPR